MDWTVGERVSGLRGPLQFFNDSKPNQKRSIRLRFTGDLVDYDTAPFFFVVGVSLVGAAGEVECFAVGGEGGG